MCELGVGGFMGIEDIKTGMKASQSLKVLMVKMLNSTEQSRLTMIKDLHLNLRKHYLPLMVQLNVTC